MLGSSEARVPKILSQISLKPNKMNSTFYLNKAKDCFRNNNYSEAYENFVNYFDSLEDPSSSTPAVQLGFTKLVCRIGMVLEDSNDTEELLKIYLQAINFFPNNYIILNNLGGYLFKMGQIDIARTYLDKAVACSKNYLPAEKNLMHCKWRQIPRWHFKMLNDTDRNFAYYHAIKKAVSEGYNRVIDIGAGCGLLSLMASEDPDVQVTAIEENKTLAKMCENVMKENQRANVNVINCYSTKLTDPPSCCNLLVTEIFDCALFGERMLESLIHAHNVLITEKHNYKIVPCRARLYASVISYKEPQNFRVVNRIPELHLADLCIRQIDADPYEAEDLTTKNIEYLSAPQKILDVDFYDMANLNSLMNDSGEFVKFLDFECVQDGSLTSVVSWFELDLDDDITITTDPRREDRVKCWEQAVVHLFHPLEVKKGDMVQFQFTIFDNQVKFYQVTNPKPCISCWLVSKEIVSFLNDAPLVNQIVTLANRFKNPEFAKNFCDPHKPIMDLMSFPLLGLILATTQGYQFYVTVDSDSEFHFVEFFEHILSINNIESRKMVVIENRIAHNSALCGIHRYLMACKACLINPISTDGSLHPTLALKEKMSSDQHNILMLPTRVVVKVVLIYSSQLETWNVVKDQNVFDFKIARFMNEYTSCEHPDLDSSFTYREYSSPVTFTVDDKDYVKKTQNMLVTESGQVNALFTWYEIQFYGTIDFSTKDSSHFKRSCYLLKHRVVESGDLFRIVMRREGSYLDFRLEE